MAGLLRSFRAAFTSRPLLSNCIVYGSLYAGAEFSQQTLMKKVLVSGKILALKCLKFKN